jgi:HK97 family phage prohead protease
MNSLEIRSSVARQPLSIDEENRTIDYVASDESVDSHGTILRQDWNLERFVGGGPVLFNHDSDRIIGGATVRVEGGQLLARVQFARDVEDAENAWQLARQGFLKGISVGFRPGKRSKALVDGREVPVLEQNTLFELSLTPVQANTNALARSDETVDSTLGRAQPEQKDNHMSDIVETQGAPDMLSRADHDAAIVALNATIEQRDARIAELESKAAKQASGFEARVAELEGKLSRFETDRKLRKLDSLEGKKFSKAERAAYAKLLDSNESLFDEIMSSRADLPVDTTVIPENGPRTRSVDEDGFAAEIERLVADKVRSGVRYDDAYRAVAAERPELFNA